MRALRAAPAALAGPVLLAFALAASSCRKAGPEGKRYALKGVVASVNRAVREVVVAHEDIPGFMPAMTMPFPLSDPTTLASLAPGDTIAATLVVGETSYRLEDVRVTGKALAVTFVFTRCPIPDFCPRMGEHFASSFTHNLRTAVFGPDGKLFRLHRGNDWTPAMLLADLREAGAPPRPAP